jgi:aminopeptidase N
VSRARDVAERTAAILRYYTSILGDAPYPALTVAVSESDTPGGHSPAYLAILNQTLPRASLVWRNDPVSFNGYPDYFLAHELAHQWWGQAVGWKNYHEQWISEGMAQYFAAINAARDRGADTFTDILRQMQRSAIDAADQGPISLGYRLGHIRSEGRVFRSILYNKSAMVLHMLRRLLGDEVFFTGLRQFYQDSKYRKAGTDDFRKAMEAASGKDLSRFIDAWIFQSDIPRLRFTRQAVSTDQIRLELTHLGEVMPLPVTVTLLYTDGEIEDVVVPVTERTVSTIIKLRGRLRDVRVDEDHAALATFDR